MHKINKMDQWEYFSKKFIKLMYTLKSAQNLLHEIHDTPNNYRFTVDEFKTLLEDTHETHRIVQDVESNVKKLEQMLGREIGDK